uniref:prostaglandin-endoperoxide synthase n=1 Tax=Gammarus sp. KV-2010a TaxID=708587 RepID=D2W903_9CRUS|nr:cyclooxygenase [Gammarus sp. KV-2010a]
MDTMNDRRRTAVLIVIAALAWNYLGKEKSSSIRIATAVDYDPCCEFPCQNQGVCMSYADKSYSCDCTNTGYYGVNCTSATVMTAVINAVKPDPEYLHTILTTDLWIWKVINNIPFIHDAAMKYIFLSRGDQVDSPVRFESDHPYTTLDAYFNETYFARTLPPVPTHCPTPMGVAGKKELPDLDMLIQKVFVRRQFLPEPHDTNLLFQYYAQHFTHQFFRTNYTKGPQFTKGNGGVDVSNIYGLTERQRRALRSNVDGKLKFQIINGEHFPPYLKDVPGISMEYPPHLPITEDNKFALGHPFFALLPGLFVYSTIWMREHNRVCEVLKEQHPHWDDERLYHTAKLIITGEVIKITIEDYVQHLSQYKVDLKFKPQVVHGTRFQFHNRINVEFDHLYHWHPLIPEGIKVEDSYYSLMDMAFSTKSVFTHGLDAFVKALVTNRAGKLTSRNHSPVTVPVLKKMLENSRILRFQGVNQYRKKFNMRPFRDFLDLTGDEELARDMEEMYGDINAVEYYVGLIAEKDSPSLTPLTMVNVGGPWSVKGLIANPICSPHWWKPSTFGGEIGFDIVNTASIEKLFCNNMVSKCQDITFKVPPGTL